MSKRRPSGDGMVRKKDDGRWEGRIVIGHKENGDSIFRYIYAPTQKELTAKLRQEITAYQGVDLTEDSKLTLNEWMDYWLDAIMAGTIRPSTLNGYRRYADLYIKPYLGDKQISKITPADVQKMYEVLKARGRVKEHAQYGHQLSGSMVHSIHTMFHEAMKAAKESHIIAKNPTENIPVPKANPKPKQILNDDQLEQFMEAIKHDAVWHDFFYTELTTGLRRGELCGLMWADFDEAAGTLAVRRTIHMEKGGRLVAGATKTGRGTRNILLPASTAQLLSERKKHSWSEWIFPNPLKPESPTNPRSAYGHLKALLDSAGLPNIWFHDLRHTFATNALEHGMDIKTLSTIIGHVTSATTLNVYAHVTDTMRENAAASIDRGIAGIEPPRRPSSPAKPKAAKTDFQPVKGKYRKPGTGCVSQIGEHLWEGRYSPKINGKRMARNVYAHTEAECEEKLAHMIREMKAEIASKKERRKQAGLTG